MGDIIIRHITMTSENVFIWILFTRDNYETYLSPNEFYEWVPNAENLMETFLRDLCMYMDEGDKDMMIVSFVLMLRSI